MAGSNCQERRHEQPLLIQRRPAPATNAREVSLPTNVVIDATTLLGVPSGSREDLRSDPGSP